jgi:IclR family transcriptional regulator, KDG regulon repressor
VTKRGYASAPEETMLGLNAVAAPIFDGNDACVAALAMVGSIQFLPERPKPAEVTALKNAAQQISRKLGHGRPSEMHSLDRRAAR